MKDYPLYCLKCKQETVIEANNCEQGIGRIRYRADEPVKDYRVYRLLF